MPPKGNDLREVLICGDILRASPDLSYNQSENMKWFSSIIKQSIDVNCSNSSVIGLNASDFNFQEFFSTIYGDAGHTVINKWARLYDMAKFDNKTTKLLFDIFSGKTVIFFEGARSIMRFVSNIGGTYLNFRVSPLRFASDLMFAVESNDRNVSIALKQFEVSKDFIAAEVSALRMRMSHVTPTFTRPTLVFLGQAQGDSSLILDGVFCPISIPHGFNTERFGANDIYHKPHPHDPNESSMERWKSMFPHSEVLDIPTYALLCADANLSVITISSGSGYEAELLGQETCFVSPNNWCLNSILWEQFSVILHEYWFPEFWEVIFHALEGRLPNLRNIQGNRHTMGFQPGRLRRTIGYEWAQREILPTIDHNFISAPPT
jgi:hypothetical protein